VIRSILGVKLAVTDYATVVKQTLQWAVEHKSMYICAANVHMVMEAYDSKCFKRNVNNSAIVTSDGMPLVWLMRLKGARKQQRVYGPTLMLHVLEAAAREKIPVGFYGGTPEVIQLLVEQMKSRFGGLNVAFSISPPFREMSRQEDLEVVERINNSGTRILFVGLGCPKQEIWMGSHQGSINAVMLGVGAAFDFHAGVKRQAPPWMQRAGLEWLFRLFTEPRRLWKRYLYHNPRFLVLAVYDLLGLLKGSS
jgi:N-acetylglucosaminyldiphosphoundecaprenol N-acetyl-beta-D-mannosaminyltransferase